MWLLSGLFLLADMTLGAGSFRGSHRSRVGPELVWYHPVLCCLLLSLGQALVCLNCLCCAWYLGLELWLDRTVVEGCGGLSDWRASMVDAEEVSALGETVTVDDRDFSRWL